MGGMRALTRVQKPKKFDESSRPGRRHNEDRNTVHSVAELNLVKLSADQESRAHLKLSYKVLPTTREQLFGVLKITNEESESKDGVLIKLQKLRDYFNPLLSENKHYEEDYQRFILAML